MMLFAKFIPRDRQIALVENRPIPTHTSGAALFASTSGFSELIRRLLDLLGEVGIEAMLDYIKPIYTALIDNELKKHEQGVTCE